MPVTVAALAGRFPRGFRFGTVTSATQVEGAADVDGRGPSIWDTWAAAPGRVIDGSTPAVACDHYRRHSEDVALLARLGAPSYRFSVAWPRVQPTGRGPVNPAGLAFYDRLVDELLEAGVDPMVTLLHADLPQALEDDGGWLHPDTAERFAEYAAVVGDRLADRVRDWVPISEPVVMTLRDYGWGDRAPGHRLMFDALWASQHALLAHGRAVVALRAAGAERVGCANNHAPMWPASDDPADVGVTKLFDALWNGLFLEPMVLGRYPADLAPLLEDIVQPGDLATIRQPLDFYGINYYSPVRVAAENGGVDGTDDSLFRFVEVLGHERTDNGWAIVPEALQEWLIMTRARYRAALPPFVITEAGAALAGRAGPDGVIDDQDRIDYLTSHLEAVANAIARGVDVCGFHVWSLLDTWEWTDGFVPRYGLVEVDHETQERRPKRSFSWYADLVAAHRAVPPIA